MTFHPSLKNAFLFFALGILFGLFLSVVWSVATIPEEGLPSTIELPKQLQKEVAVSEIVYAKKMDSLHLRNNRLATEIRETKTALTKAQNKAGELQVELFALLDRHFERRQHDEQMKATPCDSIANLLPTFVTTSDAKDSLYRTVISNLVSVDQNKDSILVLKEQQYVALKAAFTKSVEAQAGLAKDNQSLMRRIKRQGPKSKILSAALFIVSGAAATYLLHH